MTITTRPEIELYDRQADPLETRNLAWEPEHRTVRDALAAQLRQWMRQTGDFLGFEVPDGPVPTG